MHNTMYTEFIQGVIDIMGIRIRRIVLYGSVARGTDTPESDIDIALVMYGRLDAGLKDKLSDFIVDMNLKYDRVFSVIDIDNNHLIQWKEIIPFYQNLEREGIILWKVA